MSSLRSDECLATGAIGNPATATHDPTLPGATLVSGNPRTEAARQSIAIANDEIVKARASVGPTLNATGGLDWEGNRFDNANGGSTDSQTAGVRASLPIRDAIFGRPKVRSAEASARAAALGFDAAEQEILLDLAQIVTQIERDRAVLEALDQHVARLNNLIRQANIRQSTGEMSLTDANQILLKVVTAKVDRADAQASLAESISRLTTVTGSSGQARLRDIARYLPADQGLAVSAALENSPEILAAREEEVAANAEVATARRQLLPEVNLNASAERRWETGNRGGDNNLFLGVSLDMPLYDGGARKADIRQKQSAAREREFRRQSLQRLVVARVKADWARREAARSQLELASQRIAVARAALDGVGKARSIGARTIEDELSAASDLLSAIIGRSNARQSLVLAEHRLAAELGRLKEAYSVNE